AIAEDAAGREELYDPGPGRDLLADRLAHLVGTVRDASDLEAVSAGGSDTPAARDDARPLNESLLYRATELDDHRAVRAEVAHRGDARSQSRARVAKGFERRERVRLSNLSAEAGLAIERQVAVAVDHARHHERAGRGSGLGALARTLASRGRAAGRRRARRRAGPGAASGTPCGGRHAVRGVDPRACRAA